MGQSSSAKGSFTRKALLDNIDVGDIVMLMTNYEILFYKLKIISFTDFKKNGYRLPMQLLKAMTDEQFGIQVYLKYLKSIDHCFRL